MERLLIFPMAKGKETMSMTAVARTLSRDGLRRAKLGYARRA